MSDLVKVEARGEAKDATPTALERCERTADAQVPTGVPQFAGGIDLLGRDEKRFAALAGNRSDVRAGAADDVDVGLRLR